LTTATAAVGRARSAESQASVGVHRGTAGRDYVGDLDGCETSVLSAAAFKISHRAANHHMTFGPCHAAAWVATATGVTIASCEAQATDLWRHSDSA
jgi:hypothetical protein